MKSVQRSFYRNTEEVGRISKKLFAKTYCNSDFSPLLVKTEKKYLLLIQDRGVYFSFDTKNKTFVANKNFYLKNILKRAKCIGPPQLRFMEETASPKPATLNATEQLYYKQIVVYCKLLLTLI